MKRLGRMRGAMLLAAGLSLIPIAASAGPDGGAAVLAVQPVDAGAAASEADAGITVEKLAEDVQEVVKAFRALKEAEGIPRSVLIALLVAAILKGLLDALRKWGPKFISKKNILKLVCVGVGVVIFFLEHYGAGQGVWASVGAAMGGPGAILLTEVLKMVGVRHEKDGGKKESLEVVEGGEDDA